MSTVVWTFLGLLCPQLCQLVLFPRDKEFENVPELGLLQRPQMRVLVLGLFTEAAAVCKLSPWFAAVTEPLLQKVTEWFLASLIIYVVVLDVGRLTRFMLRSLTGLMCALCCGTFAYVCTWTCRLRQKACGKVPFFTMTCLCLGISACYSKQCTQCLSLFPHIPVWWKE